MIIICGSIAPLKVLWDRYIKKTRHVPVNAYNHGHTRSGYIEMLGKRGNKASQISSTTENDGRKGITATTEIDITGERKVDPSREFVPDNLSPSRAPW